MRESRVGVAETRIDCDVAIGPGTTTGAVVHADHPDVVVEDVAVSGDTVCLVADLEVQFGVRLKISLHRGEFGGACCASRGIHVEDFVNKGSEAPGVVQVVEPQGHWPVVAGVLEDVSDGRLDSIGADVLHDHDPHGCSAVVIVVEVVPVALDSHHELPCVQDVAVSLANARSARYEYGRVNRVGSGVRQLVLVFPVEVLDFGGESPPDRHAMVRGRGPRQFPLLGILVAASSFPLCPDLGHPFRLISKSGKCAENWFISTKSDSHLVGAIAQAKSESGVSLLEDGLIFYSSLE